ncbi:MAG: hypothetical protein CM15mP74_11920 [Halieaceae bacterium]|nr:MAG: hypothetical protein CM15mP74_11920 [Halieaceae bacterium]
MLAYPAIDPVAVSLGPVKIHWYGLTYIGGLRSPGGCEATQQCASLAA